MSNLNPAIEPDAWWDNQITLHPPKNEDVAALMDETRDRFKTLGFFLIVNTPSGPDLTVALRALKDASQAAIGNIACNQDHWPDPPKRAIKDNPQA